MFKDNNGNGIQDGGDTPLAGVTVDLYSPGGTLIATAVTDANGNYSFSSAIGTSTSSAVDNLSNTLLANTSGYTIKLDNPADYTSGPLAGLTLSPTNAAGSTPANDSNGVLVGGSARPPSPPPPRAAPT